MLCAALSLPGARPSFVCPQSTASAGGLLPLLSQHCFPSFRTLSSPLPSPPLPSPSPLPGPPPPRTCCPCLWRAPWWTTSCPPAPTPSGPRVRNGRRAELARAQRGLQRRGGVHPTGLQRLPPAHAAHDATPLTPAQARPRAARSPPSRAKWTRTWARGGAPLPPSGPPAEFRPPSWWHTMPCPRCHARRCLSKGM
jgi:hypothetical protein